MTYLYYHIMYNHRIAKMKNIKNLILVSTLLFSCSLWNLSLAQSGEYVEVFTERFVPNELAWPLNSNEVRATSIQNGRFNFNTTMNRNKAALIARDVNILLPDDYAIEADFFFTQGDGSGYGIIFNYSDPLNFSTFNVSKNGYYRYGYYVRGQYVEPIPWTKVSLNSEGSLNTLRVQFQNRRMLFMINGTKINELPEPSWVGSKMGFIVYGKQNIQVGRLSVFEDKEEITVAEKKVEDKTTITEAEKEVQLDVASKTGYKNKYALIIGNSDYKDSPLKNPKNDAMDMSKELESVGFKVRTVINADRTEFRRAIIEFNKDMNKNPGVGLFYYAGHGLQSDGVNYLVPIGAEIEAQFEIEDECIRADRVLRMLNSLDNPLNIIILDACRNNPYASAYRSTDRGLAMPEFAPTGSILAFATAPGKTASDGEGNNGLYTQEFIEAMKIPGLSIEEVFKRVRINVSQKSSGQQIPWENSSLMGDFYFRRNQ